MMNNLNENQNKDDDFRIEHDSMGEVKVPKSAKWAAQTQRAVENFPISSMTIEKALIISLINIKKAAAVTNQKLGILDPKISAAIVESANEIIQKNLHLDQFPVDVYQTGSGTSSNMNANEVLATLASEKLGEKVSPNDHSNASQSSNDVFPSAIHIATTVEIKELLIPNLSVLAQSLKNKSEEFKDVVKSGRTHLMDATPVTLGQEFSGYSTAVTIGIERLQDSLKRVQEIPLGGTAVGTGLNTPDGFTQGVISELNKNLSLNLVEARDHFEAQGARDSLVEVSGILRTIAVSFYKIANDLRWMSSGPNCGLKEIHLPDLQPGSSIMPGKVNPVVPEAVCQVVAQVIGNDAAVAFGGAAGNLELNVMLPVIARNLLESIRIMANVAKLLAVKCVDGIVANVEQCRIYALSSPSIGTSLNPYIGYEMAAKVIKKSLSENKDIRTIVLEENLLTEEQADKALDVLAMTKGGILK